MKIVKICIETLLENSEPYNLFTNYYNEGSRGLLDSPNVNKEIYYSMDRVGLLDVFAVVDASSKIVGFIVASTSINPNYNTLCTIVMGLFIDKQYRKHGTAKKLLAKIEQVAKDKGSKLLTVSTPSDSKFNRFLALQGYKHTNNFYGKRL